MPVLMRRSRNRVVAGKSGAIAPRLLIDGVVAARTGGFGVNEFRSSRRLLRVLIADDDRDTADSLSKLVEMWGYDPSVAYDGADALAAASDELPDVMFIDIGMPKMNGFELATHLRGQARFADTLLVAISGWADEPHRRLWVDAFDHYLIKPVDPPELETLLRDQDRLVRSRTDGPYRGPALARIAVELADRSTIAPDRFLQETSACCG